MRPLTALALFLAALALASPVDEQNGLNQPIVPNDPVLPPDEDRCRPGYDQCVAVRNSLYFHHMHSRSQLTGYSRDVGDTILAENVDT